MKYLQSIFTIALILLPIPAFAMLALDDDELDGVSGQGIHMSYFQSEYSGCALTYRGAFSQQQYVPPTCMESAVDADAVNSASSSVFKSPTGGQSVDNINYRESYDGLDFSSRLDADPGCTNQTNCAQARIDDYASNDGLWQSYRLSFDAIIKVSGTIRRARTGGYMVDDGEYQDNYDYTDPGSPSYHLSDTPDAVNNRGAEPYTDGNGWDLDAENIRMGHINCEFIYQAYASPEAGGQCNGRVGQRYLPHQYYDDANYTDGNNTTIYNNPVRTTSQSDGGDVEHGPNLTNDLDRSNPGDLRPYDPLTIKNPFVELMFAPECELFGMQCDPGVNDDSVFAGLRMGSEYVTGNIGVSANWMSGFVNASVNASSMYGRCAATGGIVLDIEAHLEIAWIPITINIPLAQPADETLCWADPAVDDREGDHGQSEPLGILVLEIDSLTKLLNGLIIDQLGKGIAVWGNRRFTGDSIDIEDAIGGLVDQFITGSLPCIDPGIIDPICPADWIDQVNFDDHRVLNMGYSLLPPIGSLLSTLHTQESHGMWISLVREDMQWPGQGWLVCNTQAAPNSDPDACQHTMEIDPVTTPGLDQDLYGYERSAINRDYRGWNVHSANRGWGHGGNSLKVEMGALFQDVEVHLNPTGPSSLILDEIFVTIDGSDAAATITILL